MWERVRYAVAALLLFVGLTIVVQGAFAQDGEKPLPEGRDSPRATMFGFLGAVKDVDLERVPDLDEARARALTYLDLEGVASDERGWEVARDLKDAIDFHGELGSSDVPDAVEVGTARYWSLRTDQGDITIERSDAGWRFSSETLFRVGRMVDAFRGSGAEKYEARTLGDAIVERFPRLGGRALFLRHWQWLGLVLLAIASWILHRVASYLMASVIGGLLSRRRWSENVAEAARNAGRPAGYFAVAALVAVCGPFLDLPHSPMDVDRWVVSVGAKLFASLGAVLILYRMADVAAERLASAAAETESRLDDQLVPLVRKSLKILVTVMGALFILDNLEVDIWSLVAGAGFAGIAFAFAAQDTVKNLFGSLTVFTDRPFQVGDWVLVAGVEGTVEEVGFRSTRVRTFYNSLVSVPNSKFVDGIVDNMGMRRYRRFKTTVGIRYDTPPERIEAFCHGMRQIVRANPNMRQDYFEIYLNDWGASSLNILVYVFFEVPDWDAELRERQNFMLEVIRLARELGVGFAFPTQTLEIEVTPDRPHTPPADRSVEEMAAIARSFAKGGERARPDGTAAFSSRERGPDDQEARGS